MASNDKRIKPDYLRLSTSILAASGQHIRGLSAQESGRFEGQQHRQGAERTLVSGAKRAGDIRRTGREVASQATAAMVAQGGMVDSEMLARIKHQSDVDAISAMYDAKADALTQQYAAKVAETRGKQEYRARTLGAVSNILRATSTYGGRPASHKRPYSKYPDRVGP